MSVGAEIPTHFVDQQYYVLPQRVAPKHALDLINLRNAGFVVSTGLHRQDAAALAEISSQVGTQEYCPNDSIRRWGNEEMIEAQLRKDGGRAVFILESVEDNQTYGFGWTGTASKEEAAITGCENTFAIRLHEKARGKGLATPFSKAIVAGSMAIYGMRGIGLETWGSNAAAVRTYLGAKAVVMGTVDSERPTQIVEPGVFLKEFNGEQRPHRKDVRVYMQYPWSF